MSKASSDGPLMRLRAFGRRLFTSLSSGTAIGAAVDGEAVRVAGAIATLEGVQPLIAPFSGKPCVYYAFELFDLEFTPSAPNGRWARRVISTRRCDFALDDHSGRALVPAGVGFIDIDRETRSWPRAAKRLAPAVRQRIAALDEAGAKVMADKNARVYALEATLEPGKRAIARGCGRWELEPGATRAYRSSARRLRLLPHDGRGPIITR